MMETTRIHIKYKAKIVAEVELSGYRSTGETVADLLKEGLSWCDDCSSFVLEMKAMEILEEAEEEGY